MELLDYVYLAVIVAAALTIDLAFGEPPRIIHPTHWAGVLASWIDSRIPRGNPLIEKLSGVAVALLLPLLFASLTSLLLSLVKLFLGKVAWMLASAYLLKLSFAVKDMERHAKPVILKVAEGDIPGARLQVSRIVGRDVSSLDGPLILSAAVESTSESIVDGFCAPVFFFALAGVPGAMFYRVVNTLDSTVGYKDVFHLNVGWASARMDDALNFVPARLSLPFIALASRLLGADWRNCFRVALRDHGKTESPNGGWPMAAMAGALKVRLEKRGKHVLGAEYHFPGLKEACLSVNIMRLSCVLFYLALAPLSLIVGFTVQGYLESLAFTLISLLR
ncbi:MAG: cobalamin biosynthesis protein [Candidatus Jordarchaeales archaeon]|nr:cobalamin biosynthesis protein [Candidatus Jordarchaeia archaeon]